MMTRKQRRTRCRWKKGFVVAAAAGVAVGASYRPGAGQSAGGWEGITGWSGTIRVELSWDTSDEVANSRGTESLSGPVTLDVKDVRDRPRRVLWDGENQTLAGSTSLEVTYLSDDGPAGIGTADGSGPARGVTVNLFMNLDEGIYWLALESGGEGITVRTTFTAGDYSGSDTDTNFLNGAGSASTGDIPLPSSPGGLSGSRTLEIAPSITLSFSWSLSPFSCSGTPSLEIDPLGWDELVFVDGEGMGQLKHVANAMNVTPEDAGQLIIWTFPQPTAVALTTDPEDRSGETVRLEYAPMPVENEDFDVEEPVTAAIERCGQRATAQVPARFFFQLDGTANPDDEEVPNWFYYWLQTAAGQGLSRSEVALGAGESCDGTYGYYLDGTRYISLCPLATGTATNPVTGEFTDGIDTYAVTVLHEMEHWRHYEEWWREYDSTEREWAEVDSDLDDVPDTLEADHAMVVGKRDTNNCGMTDEHYLAWLAEGLWAVGSADEEDWAAPGKQYGVDPGTAVPRPQMALADLCGIAVSGRPGGRGGR